MARITKAQNHRVCKYKPKGILQGVLQLIDDILYRQTEDQFGINQVQLVLPKTMWKDY